MSIFLQHLAEALAVLLEGFSQIRLAGDGKLPVTNMEC
jgi:hypothetical protein